MKEQNIQNLEQELSDLGALAGCLCIWKQGPRLLSEQKLKMKRLHDCAFCWRYKDVHGAAGCLRHDTETLSGILRKAPRPCLVRCPAGAEEYLVPVLSNGRFLGAVLTGPFRGISGAPELPVWRTQLAQPLERAVERQIAPICRELYTFRSSFADEDSRIALTVDYLEAHFAEPVTLEDAAAQVYLSASRLSHLFSQVCKQDFSTYLNRIRIRHAEILLRDTLLPIDEIALNCGYKDRSHFTTIFRKYNGLPPARFRKSFRTPPVN